MKRYFSLILAIAATVSAQIVPSTGNVRGPTSATDNAVARYDGTTGKLIQNSGVTIDDSGNLTVSGVQNVIGSASASANFPLRINQGATNATVTMDIANVSSGTSAAANIQLQTDAGTSFLRQHSAAHSVWPNYLLLGGSDNIAISTGSTSDGIELMTGFTTRVNITTATTTVSNNLTVSGGTAAISVGNGSAATLQLNQTGVANAYITQKATTGDLAIGNGSGDQLTIAKATGDATFAGQVNILNSNSYLKSDSSNLVYETYAGKGHQFKTGGTTALTLDSSQRTIAEKTVTSKNGIFSGIKSVAVAALNTAYAITTGAAQGIVVIRDDTTGGSALWLIDPNQGSIQVSSNLPKTITLTYSGGVWNITQTAGSVTTNYSFAFLVPSNNLLD